MSVGSGGKCSQCRQEFLTTLGPQVPLLSRNVFQHGRRGMFSEHIAGHFLSFLWPPCPAPWPLFRKHDPLCWPERHRSARPPPFLGCYLGASSSPMSDTPFFLQTFSQVDPCACSTLLISFPQHTLHPLTPASPTVPRCPP